MITKFLPLAFLLACTNRAVIVVHQAQPGASRKSLPQGANEAKSAGSKELRNGMRRHEERKHGAAEWSLANSQWMATGLRKSTRAELTATPPRLPRPANSIPYDPPYTASSRRMVQYAGGLVGQIRPLRPAATGGCTDIPLADVILLPDIKQGRELAGSRANIGYYEVPALQVGGDIGFFDCGWAPAAQLVGPVGSAITLTNTTSKPIDVVVMKVPNNEPGSARNISLCAGCMTQWRASQSGQFAVWRRQSRDLALFYVMPHPYAALTDQRGNFSLSEIPYGTFSVVAKRVTIAWNGENPLLTIGEVGTQTTVGAKLGKKLELNLPRE